MGSRTTIDRIDQILAYMDEYGEQKALEQYGINIETLHRYQREKRYDETRKAKILLLDIETAPMEVYVWGLYKQRINYKNIIDDWFILSWSAKWLFSPVIQSDVLTPKEAVNGDDSRVIKSIWELINESDVIIGHNIVKFDERKLNARFILNGLNPPLPYQTIDTLRIAQKTFGFSSNRLDYLGQLIRNKGKIETDFELWIRCKHGDKDALAEMETYNKEDVALLEEVYLFLRPWIKSHPNMGLLMDAKEQCCPNCGSFNIELTESYYTTPANQYRAVRCKDCGAPNRLPESVVGTIEKKQLLRSIAR